MVWHIISTMPCEADPFPEEFQEPFYDEFIDGLEEKMNIEKIISKDIKHVWKQARENTSDPSANVMNCAKFTAVMAGSIALK